MSGAGRSWSLVRRLIASLATIVLVTGSIQAAVAYLSLSHEADEVFDYQLRQTAQAFAATAPVHRGPALASMEKGGEGLDLVIRQRSVAGEFRTHAQGLLPDRLPPGFSTVPTSVGTLRVYTLVRDGRDVSVGQRLDARKDMAREVAISSLWPLPLLAVASLSLVLAVLHAALRPISELGEEVKRRDPQSLSPISDPGLPGELRPLLDASNNMIARLSAMLAHQRRFLADAAHELRTPVSAIGLYNTLIARSTSEAERSSALAAQREGIRRAADLVGQLLELSRLEARQAPLRSVEFDLASELQAVVRLHAPVAAQRGSSLNFEGDACLVRNDPSLVSSVFGNLIGNAIQHAPPGARIDVRLSATGSGAVATVEDDGPGIAGDELASMLQPFHRSADARTPGSGLGLAIAKAACERAGWSLALGPSHLGGLRAAVVVAARTP